MKLFVCLMGVLGTVGLTAHARGVPQQESITLISTITGVKQSKYWRCSDCGRRYKQDERPTKCAGCGGDHFFYYYK